MFCLCGGASNGNRKKNNNNGNNNRTKNGESGNISPHGLNGTELTPHSTSKSNKQKIINNGINNNSLHPGDHAGHSSTNISATTTTTNGSSSQIKMSKIRSASGATTPSPANHHINGMKNKNNKIISPGGSNGVGGDGLNEEIDIIDGDDLLSAKSKSPKSPISISNGSITTNGSYKPKHQRKKTHPYKSRDPHKGSIAGLSSPISSSINKIQHTTSHSIGSNKDRKHRERDRENKERDRDRDRENINSNSVHSSSRKSQFREQPSLNDYFVYDNFEFSIENFDFNSHYKFLIELAIKCLDQGPEVLNPQIFFEHNEIKCCVAILHENNNKKVPTSYYRDIQTNDHYKNGRNTKRNKNHQIIDKNSQRTKPLLHSHRREKEEVLINNVVGFALCYPHSNCRPYPDSVWMLGWLCADHYRIKSLTSQYFIIEALMRQCAKLINPNSINKLPQISTNLKKHLIQSKAKLKNGNLLKSNNGKDKLSDLDEKDEDTINKKNDDEKTQMSITTNTQTDNNEFTVSRSNRISNTYNSKISSNNNNKDKNKKKKPRDKGIGIYAPYYHKKAQQLYESLGFEKIAKIGNYYTTDQTFFDEFYKSSEQQDNNTNNKNNKDNNLTNDDIIKLAPNTPTNVLNSPSNRSHKSSHSHSTSDKTKKFANDAYLYCRGDLAHCRLLLGMEYFNYKKWPKPPALNDGEKEGEDNDKDPRSKGKSKEEDDEKQIKKTKESDVDKDGKKRDDKKDEKSKDGKKKRNYGPKILEEYLQSRIADYHAKQQKEQLLLRKSKQRQHHHQTGRDRHHSSNPYKHKSSHQQTSNKHINTSSNPTTTSIQHHSSIPNNIHNMHNSSHQNIHIIQQQNNVNSHPSSHHHQSSHHKQHRSHHKHRGSHYNSSQNVHHSSHANSNQFDPNLINQHQAYRSGSAYAMSSGHDSTRKIRFRQQQSTTSQYSDNGNSTPQQQQSSVRYRPNTIHDRPSQQYYISPNDDENGQQTLSPNVQQTSNGMVVHHKTNSIVSDASMATVNSNISGPGGASNGKSSRHQSIIANSQNNHHHYQHSGQHHYYHPHYHHSGRPTYTSSAVAGPLSGQGQSTGNLSAHGSTHSHGSHRPSATPTTTYNDHSRGVMYNYPHLSNVSTGNSYATTVASNDTNADNITLKSGQGGGGGTYRGNSFISLGSNNPSHHSHHTQHSHAAMHSTHSINSNASMHSDPYYHRGHTSSHYMHPTHPSHPSNPHNKYQDDPYNHHHQQRASHHKYHDSYQDDHPHQNHHHSSHKSRNKRYRQSSRHKKPN